MVAHADTHSNCGSLIDIVTSYSVSQISHWSYYLVQLTEYTRFCLVWETSILDESKRWHVYLTLSRMAEPGWESNSLIDCTSFLTNPEWSRMKYLMAERRLESIQNETSFHSELVKTTFHHQIFHSGSFWISQKTMCSHLDYFILSQAQPFWKESNRRATF